MGDLWENKKALTLQIEANPELRQRRHRLQRFALCFGARLRLDAVNDLLPSQKNMGIIGIGFDRDSFMEFHIKKGYRGYPTKLGTRSKCSKHWPVIWLGPSGNATNSRTHVL